jgi:hypothetical protein
METKDGRQTKASDTLRVFLQSIASLAVMAQDEIGNPDEASNYLDMIEADLKVAREQVNILWNYDGK